MSDVEVKTIKATSRASVKVGEQYYTVEYSEERIINNPDVDLTVERDVLWDVVNTECDKQVEEILKTFKK